MVKKILFVFMMAVIAVVVTFVTMFNESSKGMSAFINETIETGEYENFLKYNDYYINTPLATLDTEDYDVRIHNAFDSGVQNITIIAIDKAFHEGEESQVVITCNEEFIYEDVFFTYDEGNVAVLTLYESGTELYQLDNSCQDGIISNLQIISNDGEVIVDLTDTIGFIEDGDFTSLGEVGYDQEDLMDIQYPRGAIVPLILPLSILLVSILGIVYLYKKVFKK